MIRRCPRCNSQAVRYDRSLAGRAVCGGCGIALSPDHSRKADRPGALRTDHQTNLRNPITVVAWLIPACLFVAYFYMRMHPKAASTRMPPHSESTRDSWNISTPADIELLIGKAQQAYAAHPTESSDDSIRSIATILISKGVRVLITDNVMPHAGGEWDPSRGELRIRPSTVSMGSAALAQAFAHEGAHVAQSCRAGGINKNSEPMGIRVDPAKTYQEQLDSALYKGPLSSKAIELEAYSVGAIPEWAPKLIDHFCK